MKKTIKILIPLLLIVTIVISIGWYLLKYDPNMTRDILVSQARYAEDNGNHSIAAWFYDMAYRQSGNDGAVAIELAEQYISVGNYTKAEYTLSNAIADGGSLELYIALCKTYVAQDKLLDAVTMLDNVADPQIKAQLEPLRPASPTATPDQGYHNQYITVSFSSDDGDVYVTTDGSYPSTSQEPHTTPIDLPAGETIVYALTVSDNGLVSPVSILGYTVAGVIEEVQLQDSAIDQAIRMQLQVDDDHVFYTNELWEIKNLIIPSDAKSLEDLKWMPHLQQLVIRDCALPDLSILSSLTELQELVIQDQTVTDKDLAAIGALTNLTSLTLSDCGLSTIDPLSACTKLTRLDLSDNYIGELTALTDMQDLGYLDLRENAIRALKPLKGKVKLTELYLSHNSIKNTSALSGCSALMILDLSYNSIDSIAGISDIPGLRTLSLASNRLTDVSSLAGNLTLGDLDLSDNAIEDISALGTLEQLMVLDFSHNNITALPKFSNACPMVKIDGSHNLLTSLEELRVLQNLNYVIMEQNPEITSIEPLTGCPLLVEVNVYSTGVTDVSALTDNNSNVIVKYTPATTEP